MRLSPHRFLCVCVCVCVCVVACCSGGVWLRRVQDAKNYHPLRGSWYRSPRDLESQSIN